MAPTTAFWTLAGINFFERMAWSAFRAAIVLHIAQAWGRTDETENQATELFGWIAGLIYLLPIPLGIWTQKKADREKHVCLAGLAFLVVAYFVMSARAPWILYIGLILFLIGRSAVLAPLQSMLYGVAARRGKRRDFQSMYTVVNVGTLVGVIVTSVLRGPGDQFGAVMIACGFAALAALIFLGVLTAFSALGAHQPHRGSVTGGSVRNRLIVILVITVFGALFWSGFEQRPGALTLFAADKANMTLMEFKLPPESLQAVNPAFVIIFSPLFNAASGWLTTRYPRSFSTIVFLSWGLILLGVGFVLLAVAESSAAAGNVNARVLIILYLFHTIGELCLEPIGQSLVGELAPPGKGVLSQAIWNSASFFAFLIAGYLPAMVPPEPAGAGVSRFYPVWVIFSIGGCIGGALLWVLARPLRKLAQPVDI